MMDRRAFIATLGALSAVPGIALAARTGAIAGIPIITPDEARAVLGIDGAAKGSLTIELVIVNLDELRAQAEDIAALWRRVSLLPAALLPPLSDRLSELRDVILDCPVCIRSEGKSEVALGTHQLGIRVDLAPRVLEIVAAIRAMEGEIE